MKIKSLFKYRALNSGDPENLRRVERIFLSNELYFAPPSKFNDPFDCKLLPSFQTTKEIRRKFYSEQQKAIPELVDVPQNIIEAFSDELTELETKTAFKSSLENTLESVGICSFSGNNDDILLWSHYTNGHTGFCLEFDIRSGDSFFSRAIRVNYKKMYPSINIYEDKKWMQNILLTKSNRWEYEAEWRILKYDGPGVEQFPETSLSAVILGCQMPEKDKDIIRNLVSRRGSKVQIKEARIKEYEFGLEID